MNRVIRESFDQVRADEGLIEGTKQRLKEQRRLLEQGARNEESIMSSESVKSVKKKQRMPVFSMAAIAAACLIVGILLGSRFRIGNIGIGQSPVAYISIDVNPSIELCLNEKDKVICADAWNDDGKKILDCIDLKGETCFDAVEHLLNCREFQPYLTEDCELNLTVIGATDAHGRELEQLLKKCSAFQKHNGTTVLADREIYQEAHEHDMSFGKYLLYKELHELDHTVTTDDCQKMTIKEMKDQICAHDSTHDSSHNIEHSTTDNTHHAEESSHTESHENEIHDAGTHDTGTHDSDTHGTGAHDAGAHETESHNSGSHETEHHDSVQSVIQPQVPQQEVHHAEEEHHQAAVQVTPVPQPVPQAPVQQPCDTVVTTPSCPEPPCETPTITETPCPDSSGTSAGHDSGHESSEHHGGSHH